MSGNKDIKKKVMEALENDELKMHSKNYFILMNILVFLSTLVTVTIGIFVVNTLVFDIQARQELGLRKFAPVNINEPAFPWLLALIGLALVAVTTFIIRKRPIGYKHRNTTMLIVAFGTILAIGGALAQSNLGHSIAGSRPFRPLSPTGQFIESNSTLGVVTGIDGSNVSVLTNYNLSGSLDVPQHFVDRLKLGEEVFVVLNPKNKNEIIDIRPLEGFRKLRSLKSGRVKGEIIHRPDLYKR